MLVKQIFLWLKGSNAPGDARPMLPRSFKRLQLFWLAYSVTWLSLIYLTAVTSTGVTEIALETLLVLLMPSGDLFVSYERYLAAWHRQHDGRSGHQDR